MKKTVTPVVAAIIAVGLFASSSRGQPAEQGPFTTTQPSNSGGGAKAQCPDSHYISAFQAVKDNDQQHTIRIWCKPLRKVDIMPADPGEKGPFITKEPTSNGGGVKANCLDGYYTSAFQLFVDGDPSQQRSIHFWCKPLPKVDIMPPDLGEKMTVPFSTGGEPHGGGGSVRVASADGYFISAVQIFQSGGSGWRIVHLWRKPFPKM